MDPYVFSLSLGAAGLGVMAVTGLAGHGLHSHQGAHGGAATTAHGGGHVSDVSLPVHGGGHAHAGGHHVGHAHAGHAHAGHAHQHDAGGTRAASYLWTLLSPRVLFSLLVGAGATGLLLRDLLGLHGALLPVAAALGGVLFEAALVRPLWNLTFRFASAPALTLESCLMDEALAVSGFDRNGQGLIAVEVDGQLVQVLGTLRAEDRGVRVRAGDRVRIEEVDAKRNRCVVSFDGTGDGGQGT